MYVPASLATVSAARERVTFSAETPVIPVTERLFLLISTTSPSYVSSCCVNVMLFLTIAILLTVIVTVDVKPFSASPSTPSAFSYVKLVASISPVYITAIVWFSPALSFASASTGAQFSGNVSPETATPPST